MDDDKELYDYSAIVSEQKERCGNWLPVLLYARGETGNGRETHKTADLVGDHQRDRARS